MERIRKSNRPLNQELMRGLNRLRQVASFSEAKRDLDAARKRRDEEVYNKKLALFSVVVGGTSARICEMNFWVPRRPGSTFSKRSHT